MTKINIDENIEWFKSKAIRLLKESRDSISDWVDSEDYGADDLLLRAINEFLDDCGENDE